MTLKWDRQVSALSWSEPLARTNELGRGENGRASVAQAQIRGASSLQYLCELRSTFLMRPQRTLRSTEGVIMPALKDLPSNATVRVKIIALNGSLEAPDGPEVEIVVP